MSDSVTNVQIEDVLSSIRKLVSEEVRSQTKAGTQAEPPLSAGSGGAGHAAGQGGDAPLDTSLSGLQVGQSQGQSQGQSEGIEPQRQEPPMFRPRLQTPKTETPRSDAQDAGLAAKSHNAPRLAPNLNASDEPQPVEVAPSGDDRLLLTPAQRISPEAKVSAAQPAPETPSESIPEPITDIPEAPHIDVPDSGVINSEADILNLMKRVEAENLAAKAAPQPAPPPEAQTAPQTELSEPAAPETATEADEIPAFLRRTGVTSLEQRIAGMEDVVRKADGDYDPEDGAEPDFGADAVGEPMTWSGEAEADPTLSATAEGPATETSGTAEIADPPKKTPVEDLSDPTDFDTIRAAMEQAGPSERRAAFEMDPDEASISLEDSLTGLIHPADPVSDPGAEPDLGPEAAASDIVEPTPPEAQEWEDAGTAAPAFAARRSATAAPVEPEDEIQAEPEMPTTQMPRSAIPGAEAAMAASDIDADHETPADTLTSDEAAVIDEEMLRDLISEIVRQELQGALGERITRNVRRLVRREIQRALSAHDLT
jgi:hypothetical protein